jgi:glycosyltransferase involved in cell wall biosynthesis
LIQYGVAEDQMFFSPESVDSDFFETQREQLDREECRRSLGIERGQVVLLFCGKFNPVKDPFVLLEAVSQLENRECITLIMVGEGELRKGVYTKAQELLGQRAILPGFVNQSQLGRYYRASDVLVLPSISESWGLVVNEAMHFGLPAIVSSGVSCGPDLVREGQTGFVFPVGNAEKLGACLRELLAAPESCERMGRAAREHIRGYTPAVTVQGIKQAMDIL